MRPDEVPRGVWERAEAVTLAVFDVDGVMTDGRLFLGENGNEYKCFHVRDGQGLVMLRDGGCRIAVITARTSSVVAERMRSLGIEHVFQGQAEKGQALQGLMTRLGVAREAVCYLGDDLPDISPMRLSGLRVAVADADPRVVQFADWVTPQAGGQGAVRAVCELILAARGTLASIIGHYNVE